MLIKPSSGFASGLPTRLLLGAGVYEGEHGVLTVCRPMLLTEARDKFLLWARTERNLSAPPLRAYTGDINQLIEATGDGPADRLTGDTLRVPFAHTWDGHKYADSTIRRRIASSKV